MPSWILNACLACLPGAPPEGAMLSITDHLFHLGDNKKPEWKDLTNIDPEFGTEMEVDFESKTNAKDLVLMVQAGGVSMDWKVKLNQKEIGTLDKGEPLFTQYFKVPPSTLKDGKNRLVVVNDKPGDDIFVGRAVLYDRPLSELKGYARVAVRVVDADSGDGLPCRLTIVKLIEKRAKEKDKDTGKEKEVVKVEEELADMTIPKDREADYAARKGVLYTKKGLAGFEIPAGKYKVYATRGFEYGLGEARLDLGRLEERAVDLTLRREVDTTGYLAADTHMHTKTHSGHGDISMEERVIAVAGEGVEVAIATDHNHHTDYQPTMEKVGVTQEFSTIVGNEVTTTALGHFNAFPMDKDGQPPDPNHSDWTRLIQAIRASSGVRVVILNHPRRAITKLNPLEIIKYNPLSGEAHRGPSDLGLDAIEVVNGKTLDDNRMLTVNDWFGLLNRGSRIAAVGGSDSHAVDEIVGQARTYVKSATDDPRKMRIDEVCDAFLAGRLLVCLGLLANVEVNGKFGVGDVATGLGGELDVHITVQGPSWTSADRVALYLNGVEVRKEKLERSARAVKFQDTWRIPRPKLDAYLVVVASGPAVTAKYWPIQGGEKKALMAVTNPVWLDGDGDGKYTSPFEYAQDIVSRHGLNGAAAEQALADADPAIIGEFASLARAKIQGDAQAAYEKLMADADRELSDLLHVKDADAKKRFTDYLSAAPKVEVITRQERAEEDARLKKEEEEVKKRAEEREKKRKEEEKKKKEEEEKKRKRSKV